VVPRHPRAESRMMPEIDAERLNATSEIQGTEDRKAEPNLSSVL
jgi:hypothetical protein